MTTSDSPSTQLLTGGGEVGHLIRATDWSDTPLGPMASWPLSLRLALQFMIDSGFAMYMTWGPAYTQLYNDSFRPILGTEKHPFALGQSARHTFAEIWDTLEPKFERVMQGASLNTTDSLVPLHRNGYLEDCYFSSSYSPLRDESGQVCGILVVVIETTASVRDRLRWDENRRHLLASFEQSPVAIAVISDPDLTFRMANTFYGQMVGRTPDQLLGKPLLEALPELRGQGFDRLLRSVIDTGVPYVANEVSVNIVRQHTLETIFVNLTYQPQYQAGSQIGRVTGVLVVAIDVTEQVRARRKVEESEKRLESLIADRTRELIQANASLERSNLDLMQFASVASHDLKEPLRKIQAFGSILVATAQSKLDEAERDYLTRMINASGRMQGLVDDVLNLSKLSNQAMFYAETDLNAVVTRIIDDLDITIQERRATLCVGLLPVLETNTGQIHQLFQNLISNALKFSGTALPRVTIALADITPVDSERLHIDPVRYAKIQVADNGIGFNDAYREKIFGIFQRLHGAKYGGTGIGLAICKKIVENHHGFIEADSQPGEGATFTIILPLKQE